MNWDQVAGRWEQVKGEIKTKWAKLTDDDIRSAISKRDIFVGKLQERYGILKEEAERQVDEWMARIGHGRPDDRGGRPPTPPRH
jgi:uncharacterized protein YjbJ (UPF0337 family)